MRKIETCTGQKFNRLTTLAFSRQGTDPRPTQAYWWYMCDCGNTVEALVCHVRSGYTASCGCLKIEVNKATPLKHGKSKDKDSLYSTWLGMRERCNRTEHKSYMNYGGRGIKVCERWDNFSNFEKDMGEKPGPEYTLERRDNNGNYEPDNCYWATYTEQANNRRPRNSTLFTNLTLED